MTISEKYAALSDEYKARLMRYADELLILSQLPAPDPDPVPVPPPDVPDPECVQSSICGQRLESVTRHAVIPRGYQMTIREVDYLLDKSVRDGSAFDALCFAFDYGFVKGNRATRRGKVKAL